MFSVISSRYRFKSSMVRVPLITVERLLMTSWRIDEKSPEADLWGRIEFRRFRRVASALLFP